VWRLARKDNTTPFIIFDEIHKYRDWKNYLKGVCDEFNAQYNFLISGSGRLGIYQKGGDSLAGRYYLFHLFPFTFSEMCGANRPVSDFVKNPLEFSTKEGRAGSELAGHSGEILSGIQCSDLDWKNLTRDSERTKILSLGLCKDR
jgi:predicted AAA+ superfamily ATPase